MKYIIFFLFVLNILACSDDCEDGTLNQNIEGSWTVDNPIGTAANIDEVTFNGNNTGKGADQGSFFESFNSGNSIDFDWETTSNQDSLKLSFTNGVAKGFKILSHRCDQIVLDASVANWTLTKQ